MVVSTVDQLLQRILDSGCAGLILECLTLQDLGRFALCSRALYAYYKKNPTLRFLLTFTFSKSWYLDRNGDIEFADDHAFDKLRNGLEQGFAASFAKTEAHMLQSLVDWCGGRKAFAQARMYGAPTSKERSLACKFSSEQGIPPAIRRVGWRLDTPCKPIVIFDLHCNKEWLWTAFHPLRKSHRSSDDEATSLFFFPHTTNSLGDHTADGASTCPLKNRRRPPRFLFSSNASDANSYRLSASIVSPSFAETHLESADFVPRELCRDQNIRWLPGRRKGDKPLYHRPDEYGGRKEHYGRNRDGTPFTLSPTLRLGFCRGKGETHEERFHMVLMEVNITRIRDMLVHPMASQATPAHTKETNKRRRI